MMVHSHLDRPGIVVRGSLTSLAPLTPHNTSMSQCDALPQPSENLTDCTGAPEDLSSADKMFLDQSWSFLLNTDEIMVEYFPV